MNQADDSRIAVRFGPPDGDDAVLTEGTADAFRDRPRAEFRLSPALAKHVPGCACCVPRWPIVTALSRLFLARTRGEVAWFSAVAVVATPAGEAAVRAALSDDQVSASRFVVR